MIQLRIMHRPDTFREMKSAPRDSTVVEIRHGPNQAIVRAEWSWQGQAWVREDDPLRRALHRVIGWRPVK